MQVSTTVRIETGHATSIGRVREKQEDRLLDSAPMIAVADGMGGLSRGDFAAQTVIDALGSVTINGSTASARAEIKKAVHRASNKISKATTKRGGEGAGTTVVGAVFGRATSKDSWLVFHIGDSRMYCYEDGELTLLTTDHSVVQEMVDAGIMTLEEARYDPRRSILTRAVGTPESVIPTFRHVESRGQVLLACSDGITDELTNYEISDIIQEYENSDLTDIASAIVDAALKAGGRDNATVVLARALPEGEGTA